MTEVTQKRRENLRRVKDNISNSRQGFKKNYDDFCKYQRFTFITSMDDSAATANNMIGRPNIEFNIIEPYISRFAGEIVKSDPDIIVSAAANYSASGPEEDLEQGAYIEFLAGRVRYLLDNCKRTGTYYLTARDQLSGGFSSLKLTTDYENDRSFLQEFKIEHTAYPTLVGYDEMAQKPDKSDGRFCYEIIPMTKDEFEKTFPDVNISQVTFTRSFEDFSWSYMTGNEKIILVADYYEKERKPTSMYQLSNGMELTEKEYNKFKKKWEEADLPAEMPAIVKRRKTILNNIVRYRLIENQIIEFSHTDYTDLPLKFVDGNSVIEMDDKGGTVRQMTRPIIYQAQGAQRLKNFSGQCLADALQKMRPSQIIASMQSIPEEYIETYRDPSASSTLVWNEFHNGDPEKRTSPPLIAPPSPISPEIINTFYGADQLVQVVMGSVDMSLGKATDQAVSGKAMERSIMYSNDAATPYVHNFYLAFESICQMYIDMIPFYDTTPKTVPILTEEGRRAYVEINPEDGGGIKINHRPGDFKVKVEAGVNFAMQQEKSLQMMMQTMSNVPPLGEFMAEAGGGWIIDNMDIRGKETLRAEFEIWSDARRQAQTEQAQAMANKPKLEEQVVQIAAQQAENDAKIEMAKVDQKGMSDKAKTALDVAALEFKRDELEQDNTALKIKLYDIMENIRIKDEELGIKQQKANMDDVERVIDTTIKQDNHLHGQSEKDFERAMKLIDKEGKNSKDMLLPIPEMEQAETVEEPVAVVIEETIIPGEQL